MGNDTGNNTTAYLFRQEQLSRKATLGLRRSKENALRSGQQPLNLLVRRHSCRGEVLVRGRTDRSAAKGPVIPAAAASPPQPDTQRDTNNNTHKQHPSLNAYKHTHTPIHTDAHSSTGRLAAGSPRESASNIGSPREFLRCSHHVGTPESNKGCNYCLADSENGSPTTTRSSSPKFLIAFEKSS
jgi:hypothetical protein